MFASKSTNLYSQFFRRLGLRPTARKLLKTYRDSAQTAERLMGTGERQWAREVMDAETRKLVEGINFSKMSVLEISGDKWGGFEIFQKYKSVSYPEYDVCSEPLPEYFDLIIAEQVFEHVPYPYRAGRNVYAMLNPEGYFLITTPFLLRVHNHPLDCNRWTEVGLRYFLEECGFPFNNIYSGSWGNRACIKANFKRWVMYNKWVHSLRNEAEFPVVVWALCRKQR